MKNTLSLILLTLMVSSSAVYAIPEVDLTIPAELNKKTTKTVVEQLKAQHMHNATTEEQLEELAAYSGDEWTEIALSGVYTAGPNLGFVTSLIEYLSAPNSSSIGKSLFNTSIPVSKL